MLSVILLSYNQELFIEKAIKSVLAQKCNFEIELLIFDDGSTDKTQKIIELMASLNSNVKLFLSKKNEGNAKNGAKLLDLKLKKYVAFIDGDDEWTDFTKIQKQIDFLEKNNDYVGCFHDAKIEDKILLSKTYQPKKGYKFYSQMHKYKEEYTIFDAIERIIIANSTVVYKSSAIDFQLINKLKKFKLSGNWMMSLYVLLNGKMKYFNETWSVYNDHNYGITKKKKSELFNNNNILFFKSLLLDVNFKPFKKHIYKAISNEYSNVLYSKNSFFLKEKLKLSINYFKFSLIYIIKETFYFIKK